MVREFSFRILTLKLFKNHKLQTHKLINSFDIIDQTNQTFGKLFSAMMNQVSKNEISFERKSHWLTVAEEQK